MVPPECMSKNKKKKLLYPTKLEIEFNILVSTHLQKLFLMTAKYNVYF